MKNTLKIATVIGARPQFIKASAISRRIERFYRDRISEVIVHTGQHYDQNMSAIFFEHLGLPEPKYNLKVSGLPHGAMTGRMIEKIETVILKEKPDLVLVYGDTNSTLAAALAAAKMGVKIAHIEAGLRSFNREMPEEINRVMTDHLAQLLFCPTANATKNLFREGIVAGVHNVGDVMYDVTKDLTERLATLNVSLTDFNLNQREFALCTIHRAENTNSKKKLDFILALLSELSEKMVVVLPLHPRTKSFIDEYKLEKYLKNLHVLAPLNFQRMHFLLSHSSIVITDSGGLQKEAFFHATPCVTLREETEWVETIESGWNILLAPCGTKGIEVINTMLKKKWARVEQKPYGDGHAADKIIDIISQ